MADEPSMILVPAYEYPAPGVWDPLVMLARQAPPGGVVVVANPENGPGYDVEAATYRPRDDNYVQAVAALRRARATVIGYVYDCYGDTNPPEAENCPRSTTVEDDIARWFSTYDVDGIFIDQASHTDAARGARLVSVIRRLKPGAMVVFNPGTLPSEEFMEATDPAVVVLQEQVFRRFKTWPPTGWVRDRADGRVSIPARRLGIIAHTPRNGEADVDLLVDVASRHSIGCVYAHHAKGPIYNELSTFLLPLGGRLWGVSFSSGPVQQLYARARFASSQLFGRSRTRGTGVG
jgi:hypothetical protein